MRVETAGYMRAMAILGWGWACGLTISPAEADEFVERVRDCRMGARFTAGVHGLWSSPKIFVAVDAAYVCAADGAPAFPRDWASANVQRPVDMTEPPPEVWVSGWDDLRAELLWHPWTVPLMRQIELATPDWFLTAAVRESL